LRSRYKWIYGLWLIESENSTGQGFPQTTTDYDSFRLDRFKLLFFNPFSRLSALVKPN
jgi:hypothetical protein